VRVAQLALSLYGADVLGPHGQPLLFSHPLAGGPGMARVPCTALGDSHWRVGPLCRLFPHRRNGRTKTPPRLGTSRTLLPLVAWVADIKLEPRDHPVRPRTKARAIAVTRKSPAAQTPRAEREKGCRHCRHSPVWALEFWRPALVLWGTVWIVCRSSLGAIDNRGSWNFSPEVDLRRLNVARVAGDLATVDIR
jgi:hypothetical protein